VGCTAVATVCIFHQTSIPSYIEMRSSQYVVNLVVLKFSNIITKLYERLVISSNVDSTAVYIQTYISPNQHSCTEMQSSQTVVYLVVLTFSKLKQNLYHGLDILLAAARTVHKFHHTSISAPKREFRNLWFLVFFKAAYLSAYIVRCSRYIYLSEPN